MEKSAVILGLSRQAKFLGLPMPYAMAVGAMTVLPFILFKPVWWFLTVPIWYGLARVATKLNPNGHHVFAVMIAGDAARNPSERAASCFLRERSYGAGRRR